ncbi:MAG: hypothetical protein ACE5GW_11055, partial [Planctomycetota bacterium]
GAAAEAIPHAHRAAREALREGQVLTGIRWLERILRHVESVPPERLAPILADLSELRQIWGPPEEALRLRRGALQAAVPGRGDPPEDAVLARKLAHLEAWRGTSAAPPRACARGRV